MATTAHFPREVLGPPPHIHLCKPPPGSTCFPCPKGTVWRHELLSAKPVAIVEARKGPFFVIAIGHPSDCPGTCNGRGSVPQLQCRARRHVRRNEIDLKTMLANELCPPLASTSEARKVFSAEYRTRHTVHLSPKQTQSARVFGILTMSLAHVSGWCERHLVLCRCSLMARLRSAEIDALSWSLILVRLFTIIPLVPSIATSLGSSLRMAPTDFPVPTSR